MTARRQPPNRRPSETLEVKYEGLKLAATFSYYDNGDVAELFLTANKASSTAGINASDAAVAISLALQHGAPLNVLRGAMMRDARGQATGVLGHVLDLITQELRVHPDAKAPGDAFAETQER